MMALWDTLVKTLIVWNRPMMRRLCPIASPSDALSLKMGVLRLEQTQCKKLVFFA